MKKKKKKKKKKEKKKKKKKKKKKNKRKKKKKKKKKKQKVARSFAPLADSFGGKVGQRILETIYFRDGNLSRLPHYGPK